MSHAESAISPAFAPWYRPLTSVDIHRLSKRWTPLLADGSIDERRQAIWNQVRDIWFNCEPLYFEGKIVTKAEAIADLLGIENRYCHGTRSVKINRLDRPMQPEAWWATLSQMGIVIR